MALRIYNVCAEAGCNGLADYIDIGGAGSCEIRSGAQPAINGALTGTVLTTFALNATAYGAATANGTNATATLAGTPITDASADATGTAGFGAMINGAATTAWTGTVTITAGGGDWEIDNLSITAGQQVQLTSQTLNLPQA